MSNKTAEKNCPARADGRDLVRVLMLQSARSYATEQLENPIKKTYKAVLLL